MTNQYIDVLKETFEDMENIDFAKIQKLNEGTAQFIAQMNDQLAFDREEGEAERAELQQFIDLQIEKLSSLTGMSPEQLLATAEDAQITGRELDQLLEFKKTLNKTK